jgi:hypothetical protein
LRFALASVLAILVGACPAIASPRQCSRFQVHGFGIKRPEKPICIDMMRSPIDQYTFGSCKIEMDDYHIDMSDYLACLKAESDDAVLEFNRDVESFNCKARGGYC